jgi:hypothetical protein
MVCRTHGFFARALLTGLAFGMCSAHAQPPQRKSAGMLPMAAPLTAQAAPAQINGPFVLAVGESSAQPSAPATLSKADDAWRLSPTQRAVLREQVRRSAPRNARCPQCRPD